MTEEAKLEIDDVVQLHPDADPIYGGCFFIVTANNGGRIIGHTRFADRILNTAQHAFDAEQCKYIGTVAYRLQPPGAYGS